MSVTFEDEVRNLVASGQLTPAHLVHLIAGHMRVNTDPNHLSNEAVILAEAFGAQERKKGREQERARRPRQDRGV